MFSKNPLVVISVACIVLQGLALWSSPTQAVVSDNFADCTAHFFKGIPPSRTPSCEEPADCTDLCVGDFYASRQNLDKGAPEFAAHLMTPEQAALAEARSHSRKRWRLNPELGAEEQYPIKNALYSGSRAPYDKGHLISKENLDYSQAASDSTFFSNNFIPQQDDCNQREWRYLEKDVRDWVKNNNKKLHIVVAVGYGNPNAPFKKEGIVIPDYLVMALCDPTAKKSVAFIGEPGKENCGPRNMLFKQRSVREVEHNYFKVNGNPVQFFDDECKPCELDNDHWLGSKYLRGNANFC